MIKKCKIWKETKYFSKTNKPNCWEKKIVIRGTQKLLCLVNNVNINQNINILRPHFGIWKKFTDMLIVLMPVGIFRFTGWFLGIRGSKSIISWWFHIKRFFYRLIFVGNTLLVHSLIFCNKDSFQRHSQGHQKHLRWRAFQQQLKTFSR